MHPGSWSYTHTFPMSTLCGILQHDLERWMHHQSIPLNLQIPCFIFIRVWIVAYVSICRSSIGRTCFIRIMSLWQSAVPTSQESFYIAPSYTCKFRALLAKYLFVNNMYGMWFRIKLFVTLGNTNWRQFLKHENLSSFVSFIKMCNYRLVTSF